MLYGHIIQLYKIQWYKVQTVTTPWPGSWLYYVEPLAGFARICTARCTKCVPSCSVLSMASLMTQWVKVCLQRRRHGRCRFDPWVRKMSWRRKWQPIPVFLGGKSHGQRSQVAYSAKDYKELDMTEWLSMSSIIFKVCRL